MAYMKDSTGRRLDTFPVVGSTDPSRLAALSIIKAKLMFRETQPVVIVGCGSSTMAGSKSGTIPARWWTKFGVMLAEAFPMASGNKQATPLSLAEAVAAPPATPGIHLVNAGVAGTTSSGYLTGTTGAQVAALTPSLVVHMVGGNDFASGVSLATFKNNLVARIAQLKADTAEPCAHLLIHQFERSDSFTPVAAWAEYGRVMDEIAAEDPENVAFLDISDDFAAVGVPGADPFGIRDADLTHLNANGHALIAQVVRDGLGFLPPAVTSASGARAETFTVITSDAFTGANGTIFGRTSDALLGGTGKAWETPSATSTSFVVSNGRLANGADSFSRFYGFAIPTYDAQISAKIIAIPTNAAIHLVSRRSSLAGTNQIRATIGTDGTASITEATTGTVVLTPLVPIAAGDTVTLRSVGSTHTLYVNGELKATGASSAVPAPSHAGILRETGAGFTLDDVKIAV